MKAFAVFMAVVRGADKEDAESNAKQFAFSVPHSMDPSDFDVYEFAFVGISATVDDREDE